MTPNTGRNIVVLCDGTSNQFAQDRTSVAKLAYALVKDPARQAVYYHPGIGTKAPPGFPMPVGNLLARGAGLAVAYGLQDDIRDAYLFIMNNWRPGDQLYLFGFSRGAYTARVVAALVYMYGMAMAGNDPLILYAVDMLWKLHGVPQAELNAAFNLAKQFKLSLGAAPCHPHFVGVWDTVSSVGWFGSPVSIPGATTNPDIVTFRHAISIDERRAFFRPNKFNPGPGQDVKQVWFPGDHCDVGGGHKEAESGMSKYPLEWMAKEAMVVGLLVDPGRLDEILGKAPSQLPGIAFAEAEPTAKLHDSMAWYWRPAEFVPKPHWDAKTRTRSLRANLFARRDMGVSPLVHPVAWQIPSYSACLPPGATPA
ncbi:MAG TPA: DUF2235 domain-containing protein [Sphingomonas sp.]|uniref:T6SS phospholipase effector Tle1-like catalytic domain-containing protein n=1 Tax=Sphingomonas sp. TaxID=28214 RepID=UPI002BC5FA3B|nr:DUF2235 domain-containing protein [Sphingomonas sp.]HMI20859.1 DUF2235 domain-containing protein [Sphingomonas sp.]